MGARRRGGITRRQETPHKRSNKPRTKMRSRIIVYEERQGKRVRRETERGETKRGANMLGSSMIAARILDSATSRFLIAMDKQ